MRIFFILTIHALTTVSLPPVKAVKTAPAGMFNSLKHCKLK